MKWSLNTISTWWRGEAGEGTRKQEVWWWVHDSSLNHYLLLTESEILWHKKLNENWACTEKYLKISHLKKKKNPLDSFRKLQVLRHSAFFPALMGVQLMATGCLEWVRLYSWPESPTIPTAGPELRLLCSWLLPSPLYPFRHPVSKEVSIISL